MTTPQTAGSLDPRAAGLEALRTWEPVAAYDTYAYAQQAVDYLADQRFPVENVTIVGSDLRSVEKVVGRLSWGKVILSGLASGAFIGLWIGLLFAIFAAGDSYGWAWVANAVWFGAILGLAFSAVGYALQRGRRDFASVSQVVALRYDILVAPGNAAQARVLLARGR